MPTVSQHPLPTPAAAGDGQPQPSAAEAISEAIAAIARPPAACPGCLASAGQPFPAHTTSRFCPNCLAQLRGTASRARTLRCAVPAFS
jgi:hypothetical protein